MKTILRLLILISLCATLAYGAGSIQIENIPTTIVLPGSNDYIPVSGATRGTNKLLLNGLTFLTATRTSLAALSITGVSDGTGILVLGATAAGDGGGANYYWSASSSATPNGNTVIQPTSLPATGRWLKAVGGVGAPSAGSLGGVFSNAGTASRWVSAINTDGSVTLTQPAASDISGLGTMAQQGSSTVSITGGTIDGVVIGGVTPAAGTFNVITGTSLVTSGSAFIGGGGGATHAKVVLNGGGTSGSGAILILQRASTNYGALATDSELFGGASNDIDLWATAGSNLNLYANNVLQGSITSTGLNGITIGATTPGASTFTTSNWSSNANRRTTKNNLNLTVVNVKDSGATGNGSTDDTAAIQAAAALVTSNGALYFPPGNYRITSGFTFSGLTNVKIFGDGATINNDSGSAGGNTLVIDNTCLSFEVCNIRFLGTSTVRGSGIHIRLGASHSSIHDCWFQGCSDFGVLVSYGAGSWISDVRVSNCTAYGTLGDGFHFGSVTDSSITNCESQFTGDDGLGIVADTLANAPNRIEVTAFKTIQAGNPAGGGTHGCGIRIADGCVDVHIVGGSDYQPAEAGVYSGRAVSTTVYNARVVVENRKVMYPMQHAGMLGGINITFTNQAELHACRVEASVSGSGFAFLDDNDLVVSGCSSKSNALRAFACDDGTTANVASNWSNWQFIANNSIGTPSNEIYYFTPGSGITITNLTVTGCIETGCSATNYIFTNRLAGTPKINNCTSTGGKAIANGGSGVAPTVANNN